MRPVARAVHRFQRRSRLLRLGFGKSTEFSLAGRAYYKEEVREFIPDVGSSTAWNSEYVSAVLPNVGVYLMQAGNFIHEDVPIYDIRMDSGCQ